MWAAVIWYEIHTKCLKNQLLFNMINGLAWSSLVKSIFWLCRLNSFVGFPAPPTKTRTITLNKSQVSPFISLPIYHSWLSSRFIGRYINLTSAIKTTMLNSVSIISSSNLTCEDVTIYVTFLCKSNESRQKWILWKSSGDLVWDVRWTKWHWVKFLPVFSVSLC
jgi:hypothetical protein